MNVLLKNIENFIGSNWDNFVTQKCTLKQEWIYIQGKMKGSVFIELALEPIKNKNNWAFFTHLVYPFSSISRDVLRKCKSGPSLLTESTEVGN